MAYRWMKRVTNLAEKGGRSKCDKLGRRRKYLPAPRSTTTTIVYRTDRQELSTARFCDFVAWVN